MMEDDKNTSLPVSETSETGKMEMMKEILENQRRILKEIQYNRFAYGIIMVLIMGYIYLEMKKYGDILGTLIEIFLPN